MVHLQSESEDKVTYLQVSHTPLTRCWLTCALLRISDSFTYFSDQRVLLILQFFFKLFLYAINWRLRCSSPQFVNIFIFIFAANCPELLLNLAAVSLIQTVLTKHHSLLSPLCGHRLCLYIHMAPSFTLVMFIRAARHSSVGLCEGDFKTGLAGWQEKYPIGAKFLSYQPAYP